MSLNRALYLRSLLVVAALSCASPAVSQQVNHIVLFIGDGMQLEHEIATSRYLYGRDYSLSFQKLPYKGVISTWDVTAYNKRAIEMGKPAYDPLRIVPVVGYQPSRGGKLPYPLQTTGIDESYFIPGGSPPVRPIATDSASAATAWATGYKTDDGNIAWLPGDPAGGALPTAAEILRMTKGFAIGVASTVPFTHATPAAQVSHNPNRNNYHAIAAEILTQTKPEVVIGGGHPNWAPGSGSGQYMSTTLYAEFKAGNYGSEYVFVERTSGEDGAAALLAGAEQAVLGGKKLFGLFGGSGGNFESPIPLDQPGAPQVTRATIENPLLKDAVLAALRVLSRDPDGFFVLFEQGDIDWAAHANDFSRIVGTTWDLHEAVEAAIAFVNQPGDDVNWGNTLILVTADHATSYLRLEKLSGQGDLPAQTAATGPCPDTFSATNCPEYPDGEVSFGTTYHTGELTRLYVHGPAAGRINGYEGTWYPCTTIIDNTQLFHIMLDAAGADRPSPLHTVDAPLSCADGNGQGPKK